MRFQLQLRPSLSLAAMLATVHGAALVIAFVWLPAKLAVALAAVLLVSLGYYQLRDAWLRLPDSCVGLVFDGDGLLLLRRDGGQEPCRIGSASLVTPALTVVHAVPEGGFLSRGVAILPDSLDGESFRRLRVWLKWGDHSAERQPIREAGAGLEKGDQGPGPL